MKWEEMGVENIESVLEKIWDLHDKLSDAIHSTSRSNFLNSIRSHNAPAAGDATGFPNRKSLGSNNNNSNNRNGFVYFKDYSGGGGVDFVGGLDAVQEAKSLNAIRSALENLEDQLEFFHTIQTQRQTERDAAISRIEQSRVMLAMKLAEHEGKKYDVIKEAQAFVGDVCQGIVSPAASPTDEKLVTAEEKNRRRNAILNGFKFGFNYVKRSLKLDCIGGLVGNAALVAISMFALTHFQEVGMRSRYMLEQTQKQEDSMMHDRITTRVSQLEGSSSSSLNVLLARG